MFLFSFINYINRDIPTVGDIFYHKGYAAVIAFNYLIFGKIRVRACINLIFTFYTREIHWLCFLFVISPLYIRMGVFQKFLDLQTGVAVWNRRGIKNPSPHKNEVLPLKRENSER